MATTGELLDDSRLAYRRWGDGPGAPVVMLHALGEDSGTWEPIAGPLARGRPVYALDLRGHGASHRSADYALESMTDDVLAALDELGLRDVSLVGHSLGGIVAYLAAARQPAALARLVLEEVPPPVPRPPRPSLERPSVDLPFDWSVIPAVYAQTDNPDPRWWDALTSISVPTLLIAGGDASHVDQQQLAAMAARIESCRMVTIDAGHHVHTNQPEAFLAAVATFLPS